MTSETRYFYGDQHTINGLTAYKLNLTSGGTARSASRTLLGEFSGYWGIRVWKRSAAGVETEVTLDGGTGTAKAIVSRAVDGFGLQSNTVAVSQIVLVSTDAIVVRVYQGGSSPPTFLAATFITEQLGAQSLDNATWTVWYYTYRYYDPDTEITTLIFYFGSTYDSRIINFTWTPVSLIVPHAGLHIPEVLPLLIGI